MKTILIVAGTLTAGFLVGFFIKDYQQYTQYKKEKIVFESKWYNRMFNRKYK
jgi:hypothetical protein